VKERKTADLCCQEVSEALKSLSSSLAASVRAFSTTSLSLSCAPFDSHLTRPFHENFSKFSRLAAPRFNCRAMLAALLSLLSHFADPFRTPLTSIGRFSIASPSFVVVRAVGLSCDSPSSRCATHRSVYDQSQTAAFSGRFP